MTLQYIVHMIDSPRSRLFSLCHVRDLPGIIEGAADGRGRGRQVISTARTCNLILIVLDASKPVTHKKIIEHELFSFGIRINQEVRDMENGLLVVDCDYRCKELTISFYRNRFFFDQPPDVKFIKKESGGIGFQETVKQTKGVNAEVARLICKEYKISCAEIILREDITVDQVRQIFVSTGSTCFVYASTYSDSYHTYSQLIDVIEGDRAYIPGSLKTNERR